MSAFSGSPIVTDGLVLALDAGDSNSYPGPLTEIDPYFSNVSLLLHMDGSNGSTTFTDSSSNALTVTANGGAQISTAQSKFGGASASFVNVNGNLSVSNNAALNLSSGDFTIELWIYAVSLGDVTILDKDGVYAVAFPSYLLALSHAGDLVFLLGNGGGTNPTVTNYSVGTISTGAWYHVALTKAGTTIRTFLNGNQITSTSQGIAIVDGGRSLLIGGGGPSGDAYFPGYIDDFRITKGICRYNSSFTPPTAPFANSSNTWYDLSGNGNNGTLVNGPTYSSANGGTIGFDGVSSYVNITSLNMANKNYTVMGFGRYVSIGGRLFTAKYNNWLMGHWSSTTENYFAEGWVTPVQNGPSDTNWRFYAATGNIANDIWSFYVNGNLVVSNNGGSQGPNGFQLGSSPYGEYSNSQIGNFLVYNRVLTSTEIQQNYNALKGRYFQTQLQAPSLSPISPLLVTDGLALYLDASNSSSYPGSGTTWYDLSGNGNNATLVNGPTYDSANGGSIVFDGVNDYGYISTTSFSKTNGQEITVSCWINPSRTSGQYSVFCAARGDNSFNNGVYNWIFYQHTNDGAISFHGSSQNKSSYIPTTGQWINVVNTVSSTGISILYVNGISIFTATGYTYGGYIPNKLSIGADYGGAEAFQGNISQVSVYNRALSASEVQQNYNYFKGRFGL